MTQKIYDKNGIADNCHFNRDNVCTALKAWYKQIGNRCGGCPFFKTDEEFEECRKRSPHQLEVKAK